MYESPKRTCTAETELYSTRHNLHIDNALSDDLILPLFSRALFDAGSFRGGRRRAEAFAGLVGFGGARVAAEDFAEGGAVVAVTLRGGVEVEDDADAAVAVEAVVSANGKKRGAEGYDQPSALHTTGKKILEDAFMNLWLVFPILF